MKILFVEPYESSLFSFRKELLDELIIQKHQVILAIASTKKVQKEYSSKIKIINVHMNLKDKNIFSNLKLKQKYKKIIKSEKPDLIISYTIKPNIYCGFYSKKIPIIANITGLGNMFKSNNMLSKLGILLYRKAFKNVNYVFFQNYDGLKFFEENKIRINNYKIIPGSGVNINRFKPLDLNSNDTINFLFASRALKEKGFHLLIEAIPFVLKVNKNVHFNFLSFDKEMFANIKLKELLEKYHNYITILDRTDDIAKVYSNNDFLISPSFYREGISNVLLESLACGRPIITTKDNPGCKEVLQDGLNGFGIVSNDLNSLVEAIKKAASLPKSKIRELGINGRKFVIENFDRKFVVQYYLDVIDKIKELKKE
ncbi:MAG: glycosyltransferase [Bacilli bacterium]